MNKLKIGEYCNKGGHLIESENDLKDNGATKSCKKCNNLRQKSYSAKYRMTHLDFRNSHKKKIKFSL
jgi:hypothetical protein